MEKNLNTLLEKQGLARCAQEDVRRRVHLPPTAVVWTSAHGVTNSAALLENHPVQVSLHNSGCCELEHTGEPASILLDFGRELAGGVQISFGALTGAKTVSVRVRFGESATEAMSEIDGAGGATNDHACRDWTICSNFLSTIPVGDTGFRFVRLDLLTPGASVQLCSVKAELVYRDLPYLGSFSCNDELINRIWETGAYTVHLNMQRYIWDGIKRDRLVWIGDLHPEISSIQAVFGDLELIRDSIDFVSAQTPASEWMNDYPSYSMWWIIIQEDYYMQSGNREYLAKQLPYLKELFGNLSRHIDANGKNITPNRFLDWPTFGHEEATDAGMQALHTLAAQASAHIFEELGEHALAQQAREDCERLRQYAVSGGGFKQAAAMAALAGLMDAKQVNEEILKPGGAAGMTSFMGYYMLLAQAKAQDYTGALAMIREFWGGMLHLGATTFWEDFDIQWLKDAAPIDRLPKPGEIDVHASYGKHCYIGFRHSLCHGWASGPTAWLSKCVLGIQILEPGFRKVKIVPQLGDLEWAKGTYPTPYGVIELEHRRLPDGSIQSSIHAPEQIEIVRA